MLWTDGPLAMIGHRADSRCDVGHWQWGQDTNFEEISILSPISRFQQTLFDALALLDHEIDVLEQARPSQDIAVHSDDVGDLAG